MTTPEVCGAVTAQCRCKLEAAHESPHECENEVTCNGSWEDRFGPFKVIRFPGQGCGGVYDILFGDDDDS